MPTTPMIVLILSGTLSCGQGAVQEIEARSAAHTEAPAVLIVEDTSPLSQTARAEQFVITAARYDNAWTLPLVLDDTDVTYPATADSTTPAETSAQTEWLRLVLRHIAYQTSRSELAGPRVPASGSPSGVPRHMRKRPRSAPRWTGFFRGVFGILSACMLNSRFQL